MARHQPDAVADDTFSLDAAQFVLARSYGFASWPRLRQHVATLVPSLEPPVQASLVLTVENHYHARPGRADAYDIERCVRAHPELGACRPLVSVHYNGVKVIAFAAAQGSRFCELSPTTITASRPGDSPRPPAGQARLLFHTVSGTLAGVVAPEVGSLSLERPTDLVARQQMVVVDGIFVAPNAFTVTPSGLVFRVNQPDWRDRRRGRAAEPGGRCRGPASPAGRS